ncbi:hypothetical protein F5Y08DRAFT_342171 [Xylaria arbuscula]|nr:hypothetical protein F5Y08DRAFT_342171 [Xylaria arbuscula]
MQLASFYAGLLAAVTGISALVVGTPASPAEGTPVIEARAVISEDLAILMANAESQNIVRWLNRVPIQVTLAGGPRPPTEGWSAPECRDSARIGCYIWHLK